jgi:3-phosphoshikimate 1-carboxyvinyltransferase
MARAESICHGTKDPCARAGPAKLKGIDVDMHHISDTVMTLAALAPLAEGPTTIRNVANIRIKETDRLVAIVNELRRLGQGIEHGEDWITITPAPVRPAPSRAKVQASHLHVYQSLLAQIDRSLALQVKPAEIECYADHRIAMSFAVLGCAVPGVTIKDPACTAKTYPKFFEDLEEMRGKVGARKASEEGGSEQESKKRKVENE